MIEQESAGHLQRCEFARHGVSVEPPLGRDQLIEVRGSGQRVRIGRFLRADLRPVLNTDAQLADMERTLNLANEGNSELTFAWLQIALAHRYQPSVATAEKFLTSQGRRKFVLPLFQTLWNEGDWGRTIARRIYAEARPLYHPVTSGSVDQLVGRS